MKEYDVWQYLLNGRCTYRAVEAVGPVQDAKPPMGSAKHLYRVQATNKRQAVYYTVRLMQANRQEG
jgi:hypothetical protein